MKALGMDVKGNTQRQSTTLATPSVPANRSCMLRREQPPQPSAAGLWVGCGNEGNKNE